METDAQVVAAELEREAAMQDNELGCAAGLCRRAAALIRELERDAKRIDRLAAIYSRTSKANAEGLHTYALQFDAPGGLNFRTAIDQTEEGES